jgi:hypothetical protein
MSELTPEGKSSITWPVGSPPGNVPTSRFDVLRWDYFTDTEMYLNSDFSNVKELEGADKKDIQVINHLGLSRKFKGAGYHFIRLSPLPHHLNSLYHDALRPVNCF